MNYFESLLEKRGYQECPLPLWKLKITDEEFEELRTILEKRTHIINVDNPFLTMCRESALFFAEYWRRMYVDGGHRIGEVYEALESTRKSVNLTNEFYEAAKIGATKLGIERYDGGRADNLNDMLYQGGLPMRLVTQDNTNSVWDRFTRGLVNRRINFEELNLGIVAAQSNSMREYCDQLIEGLEEGRYDKMPFYCADENNSWYLYLKDLARQERTRLSQLRPFSLDWIFEVNHNEKTVRTFYTVKGPRKLPAEFLETHGLANTSFFSAQVRKDGSAVKTFDYRNNFSSYEVTHKKEYLEGETISLYLHNQQNPHLADSLDMSVPHLLFRNEADVYELGNRIGRKESLLLFSKEWETSEECPLDVQEYIWGDTTLCGIRIPYDFTDSIVLRSQDGDMTFSSNTSFYWTEIASSPLFHPSVVESIYDASRCVYKLGVDSAEESVASRKVQYKSKRQTEWTNTPSFGEIFVRAIEPNGNFVTPIRLINIGTGLDIHVVSANSRCCKLKVCWPHGRVSTNEGTLINRETHVWEINRENCQAHKIHFTFTPEQDRNNHFTLSIKAPFKDFSITTRKEEAVRNNSLIPYTDIEDYNYHIVGQDCSYTYGNINRRLRWRDNQLQIVNTDNREILKSIPYEGSLITLFESRELLRSMLEKTSMDITKASIPVTFTLGDGSRLEFCIKEFPFTVEQDEIHANQIIIKEHETPINYTGTLKLHQLSSPENQMEVKYNEESRGHILPEEIRAWGKTILTGKVSGRIRPTLVDLTENMDQVARREFRKKSIAEIRQELNVSTIDSDVWRRILSWFNQCQKSGIPATSILELACVAEDHKTLLCFAFLLYIKCENSEEELLKEKLKIFSNQVGFQWYWLNPYLPNILMLLNKFIQNEQSSIVQEMQDKWLLNLDIEERIQILREGGHFQFRCYQELERLFKTWLEDLCISSLLDSYNSMPLDATNATNIIKETTLPQRVTVDQEGYIEENQEALPDDVKKFFNAVPPARGNFAPNELWLLKRVQLVVEQFTNQCVNRELTEGLQQKFKEIADLDEYSLFALPEEIRRSIIYCAKSSNAHFINHLYDELAKQQKH